MGMIRFEIRALISRYMQLNELLFYRCVNPHHITCPSLSIVIERREGH